MSQNAYLAGTDYSIADIATFPWFRTLAIFYDEPDGFCRDYPYVWDWYHRIMQRPQVKKAFEFVGSIKSTVAGATELSGRGKYAGAISVSDYRSHR